MATLRMGTVWDRTVDVLQGRTGILATIAALYVFLPNVVNAVVSAWAQADPSMKLVSGIVTLVTSLLLLVGLLAITSVASDPAVDRGRATSLALGRFGAALGIILLVALAAMLAFIPAGILFAGAGMRMNAAGQPDFTQASGGMLALGSLLALVAMIAGLIVSAKLSPLLAVIVNERLGLGAIGRAWRLTRGSTARLVGVILLYAIVLLVVLAAVSSVTGIVARLLLGPDADIAVGSIVGIVGAVVTTIATVVQSVFYAQFYVAAVGVRGTAQPVS